MPFGAYGELYVSGPGIARGYLHRPVDDAVAFTTTQLCPSDRLFKTRDIVRYTAGEDLLFVGKVDSIVHTREGVCCPSPCTALFAL